MRRLLLPFWLGLCVLFAFTAARAEDEKISEADTRALQAVIRAQLDAFAADDAAKAYSYASPGIRGAFRTPEIFMEMVRRGYPVVYRPASVVFLAPEHHGRDVLQPVQMTDKDGVVWLALYLMQRQGSGVWLTNGCQIARSRGQVTRLPQPDELST